MSGFLYEGARFYLRHFVRPYVRLTPNPLYKRYAIMEKKTWAVVVTTYDNNLSQGLGFFLARQGFNLCVISEGSFDFLTIRKYNSNCQVRHISVDFSKLLSIDSIDSLLESSFQEVDVGVVCLCTNDMVVKPFNKLTGPEL